MLGIFGGFPIEEIMVLLYRLDHLDCIDWIKSSGLYRYQYWVCLEKLAFYALAGMSKLACYCMDGTDVPGGTGVVLGWYGVTDISRRQNGSATIGS